MPLDRPATPLLTLDDYLRRIVSAKVYDVAVETPLDRAPLLSERIGNTVLLKREDTQPVFSFKLRGAYNKMANLPPDRLARGVICASAGNHAQGVAMSARRLGCTATVVMPVTTPSVKVDAVRSLGALVVLHGDSYSDAFEHAVELQRERGLTFVHPFDDPDVIAGQGTIAMEILRQHQAPIDAVFVAVGGGGLISGVAAYIKAVRPEIRMIGVQMDDSDAMVQSIAAGHRVQLDDVGLFCDGTAVKLVGEETFRMAREYVDDFVVVDTDAVCAAIKDVFQDTRSILEPAGALGLAGLKQYVADQRAGRCHVGRDHVWRQHELRSAALRRRAGRGARGDLRRHDPGGDRELPPFRRTRRRPVGHRVQLPHLGQPAGPRVRRSVDRRPQSVAVRSRAVRGERLPDDRPHPRRPRQGARAPHGRRPQPARRATSASSGSCSPSVPVR